MDVQFWLKLYCVRKSIMSLQSYHLFSGASQTPTQDIIKRPLPIGSSDTFYVGYETDTQTERRETHIQTMSG